MNVIHSEIGCWTVCKYEMARHSVAESYCFEWVVENAKSYDKNSLDELLSNMKIYMGLIYRLTGGKVKDTISFSKNIGAVIGGTNEIDHYNVSVKNSKGSVVMIIGEPIGTQRGKGLFKNKN